MDIYVIKLVTEQMESLSRGYMNTHFQLFCIFEDFYNKILGKKQCWHPKVCFYYHY